MQISKKRVKNDWISPGLSLNEAINFFERSLCICHQSWCWHCDINMSHSKTKPRKWPVRRVQAQVSLGICPVRSESSLSAWRSLGSFATHFVGFVVLRLNSLLCKSIKLRQLILSFFFLFCGCQGGKGDGTDVYIINSVDFSLQYEICNMSKFWGQSWSYVISIQKDWKKSLWIPVFKY